MQTITGLHSQKTLKKLDAGLENSASFWNVTEKCLYNSLLRKLFKGSFNKIKLVAFLDPDGQI